MVLAATLFAPGRLIGAPAAPAQTNQTSQASNAPPRVARPESTNFLAGFQIKAGFRLELVVGESLVASPVAMAFDENGRLFVVEQPDYPGRSEQLPHPGRIRLLEDTDGDGIFDTSRVYADNLPWPSAVACYGGGVFVAATPDILYLKDTKGDGIANVRRVVFTGLGPPTNSINGTALVNNFAWGLDNRIHGASGRMGGTLRALGATEGELVLMDGSDFSFDPRTLTLSADAGPSESGLTFDNWGRKFGCDFARPLRQAMSDPRYAARNLYIPRLPEMIDVASPATQVFRFPDGQTPRPRSNRPGAGQGAALTNQLAPTWLTNARGCVVFRGSLFPSNFVGNVFTADPEAHLIHRTVLRETGLELVAGRAPDEANTEFLVCRELSFSPMQVINGPEGGLYVADWHNGDSGGRIYRIVPTGFQQGKIPKLGKIRTYDLVAALASPNGYHGDTAARLIFERQDPAAAALLSNMLNNSRLALARLRALHALDGLEALSEADVRKGLSDSDARVREHAVRLAEKFVRNGDVSDLLWNQFARLATDPSIAVRRQLALTLGELRRTERLQLLAEILRVDIDNRWNVTAVLESLQEGAAEMLAGLARDPRYGNDSRGLDFLKQLSLMLGVRNQKDEVNQVLDFFLRANLDPGVAFTCLGGIGEGLHRAGSSLAALDPQNRLQPFYDQVRAAILNETVPTATRVAAVRLRAVSPYASKDTGDFFLLVFGMNLSEPVQAAALSTLGQYDNQRIASDIMDRWQNLMPVLRPEAVSSLLAHGDRVGIVLAGLETGRIARTDLTPVQIDFLRTYRDPALMERAVALFGALNLQRPEVVQQFRPALHLAGATAHGRQLFNERCASCHRLGGEGKDVGPDLLSSRIYGREKLMSSILEPSREITPGFTSRVVETVADENLIGMLVDGNSNTLTLRQANGEQIILRRTTVRGVHTEPWSLMPIGLEQGLAPQDLADLLDYVLTAPK